MDPSPKNDFTGYNEARALVLDSIEICKESRGNAKEERAERLMSLDIFRYVLIFLTYFGHKLGTN